MNKKIKVRFAPSPTGALHVGGIRTALFNYLFAKKHGGEFLLRIEDTDQTRFVEGAEKYIIDALTWLGIPPDKSLKPDGTARYKQSEREYLSFAKTLIDSGHAYYAFDSTEDLTAMRDRCTAEGRENTGYNFVTRLWMKNSFTLSLEVVKELLDAGTPYVIRFNMPTDESVVVNDIVKGTSIFDSKQLDDKILFKSDGLPTYHLANVVDDHLMEITHVIRADEWFPSTPLHVMLYKAFGWDAPEFCHLPLVLGPDGKKISKRKLAKYGFPIFPMTWDYKDETGADIHITGFKDEGYEPDALINFLALVGWNPGDNREFMTMDEMISAFDLDRVNSSGAIFDIDKLKNFNAHYLRNRPFLYLFDSYIRPNAPKDDNIFDIKHDGVYAMLKAEKIENIAKDRSVFSKELYSKVSYFFEPLILKDGVVLKNPDEFKRAMKGFWDDMEYFEMDIPCTFAWEAKDIQSLLEEACRSRGIKIGKVLPDLRMALTGGIPGPHLDETMEILGREESKNRIENLLKKIKEVAE